MTRKFALSDQALENLVDYNIEYQTGSPLTNVDSLWLRHISAELRWTDDDLNELVVGKATFYFLDLDEALQHGWDAWELLDCYSQTAVYIGLYGTDDQFIDEVDLILGEPVYSDNLFIVDRIEIIKAHRGQGLAALMLQNALKLFGRDAGICALKPFPLQAEPANRVDTPNEWQSEMGFINMDNSQQARKRLTRFYENMGLERVGESEILIASTESLLENLDYDPGHRV